MDDLATVYEWAKSYDFSDEALEYATILALKILDGECKMDYDNYNLFMSVYDGIQERENSPFTQSVHMIIGLARSSDPLVPTPVYANAIHELRVAMMQNMQKPKMKAYKDLVWSVL